MIRKEFVHEGKIHHFHQPDFVHDFGDNLDENPSNHEFKGSFVRHRTVERILLIFRENFLNDILGDGSIFYEPLNAFVGIFFGLNCSFPATDVARYTVWNLKRRK